MKLDYSVSALQVVALLAKYNYCILDVSKALGIQQSGASALLKRFEKHLGFEIVIRNGKRFKGATLRGRAVVEIAADIVEKLGVLERLKQ